MDAPSEVLYVVRSWPRLSQTFVLDELLGMQRLGHRVRVVALTRSNEPLVQPEVADVTGPVDFLPVAEGAWSSLRAHLRVAIRSPLRYLRAWWGAVRLRRADRGYHAVSWRRCLTLGMHLTAQIRARRESAPVSHLHAHFAHDPAAVTHVTHLLTGVPWSFTAHARDLWQVPTPVLQGRARTARFVVACSRPGAEHLRAHLSPDLHGRVRLIHHGVDVDAFVPRARRSDDRAAPLVVSVARLVEKKGLDDLVDACGLLAAAGRTFRCVVYGDGPMRAALTSRVEANRLTSTVAFAGERTRAQLRSALTDADAFALTPFVTDDGDRDGVPNVLVEAMACGVPVVATAAGGVADLVVDGVNGLLVPPRDVSAIADALARLLDDAALRRELGAAARRTVVDSYDARTGVGVLSTLMAGGAG